MVKERVDPETGEVFDEVSKGQVDLEEYLNAKGRRQDEKGREIPDPRPMAPPVGFKRSPSLAEQIRAMVRSEQLASAAAAAGVESFEEADDFEVGDDFDPQSPYEEQFDPTPIRELKKREREARRAVKAAEKAAKELEDYRSGLGDEGSVTGSQGRSKTAREALDDPASPKPVDGPGSSGTGPARPARP